ncbi:hypothetical protein [Kitasatospora sp. NPDC093102]|uniref:hypothetical protein n=1 Tax=Kitasatospora sp. NPDC093102 TaxID=3155069 RepID=UPI0034269A96
MPPWHDAGGAREQRTQITGADETVIVHETVAFLVERRPVIDIPPMIDLDDLADAYGTGCLNDLSRRLTAR